MTLYIFTHSIKIIHFVFVYVHKLYFILCLFRFLFFFNIEFVFSKFVFLFADYCSSRFCNILIEDLCYNFNFDWHWDFFVTLKSNNLIIRKSIMFLYNYIDLNEKKSSIDQNMYQNNSKADFDIDFFSNFESKKKWINLHRMIW